MNVLPYLMLTLLSLSEIYGQNWNSPCPSFFQYRPPIAGGDTWQGDFTLTSPNELSGVWLRIVFDKTPLEVTSTIGEVVQRGDTEYIIRRVDKGLEIGETELMTMFVKFDKNEEPPKLVQSRLNARVVCPE